MTIRPILFSAPMVKALIEGRKTQTRRIINGVPNAPDPDNWLRVSHGRPVDQPRHKAPYLDAYCSERRTDANPRGMSSKWGWWTRDDRWCVDTVDVRYVPGDLLWVRETWGHTGTGVWKVGDIYHAVDGNLVYRADGDDGIGGWFPAIHMPRRASRLTLEVTQVRVQRLQEISEADAVAEGCPGCLGPNPDFPDEWDPHPVEQFRDLWDSINGKRKGANWSDDPWIVALTFKVHRQNVDRLELKAA